MAKAQLWVGMPSGRPVPIQVTAGVVSKFTTSLFVTTAARPYRAAPTPRVVTMGLSPAATIPPWTAPVTSAAQKEQPSAARRPQPCANDSANAIDESAAVCSTEREKKLPEIVTNVIPSATIPVIDAARTMIRKLSTVRN